LSPRDAALESTVASLAADVHRAEDAAERLAALEHAVADHGRQLQVRATMDWVEHATLRGAPLVSVVLPTRDRRDLLPRAIESVQKQSYGNWELLIVDDGSVDRTAEFLAGVAGDRVRCFRHHGAGACAARNVALAQVRGDLIAYLDDDNMMHPGWLKAVVWGFEQRPEANVLYGGYVVDDAFRINRKRSGDLPRLFFLPYDHHQVARRSVADMGCIAHRAGLPEAHFDESLREMGDWDLFLRLTRTVPPLALPAIACFYTTDAPHRLSHGPTFDADVAAVRAKNRR
jgi:glycosyltransferase involved in cell wall biosynthesis